MAKVSFTKFGLKVNQEIKTIEYNGQIIEVKQYLPIQEKLQLISDVINLSADENNFANPVKVDVYTIIEIVDKYTNINFTEKQKEDTPKIYDLLISSGIAELIIDAIPEKEYLNLVNGVKECVDVIYKYQHSAYGIVNSIIHDYNKLDLDATDIQQKIADPTNIELLKNVLEKLG